MTEPAVGTRPTVRAEYVRRREARQDRADRLLRRYHRVTRAWKNIRILICAIVWEEMNARLHSGTVLLVCGLSVLIVVLILWANHIFRNWRRAARATAYYEHRLAVLDGEWAGRGEPGDRYLDDTHSYAADLDLFGDSSLYELLCTARTRAGQDALAAWLLRPAPAAEVRQRQSAVVALRDQLDLREDMELIAGDAPPGDEREVLTAWAERPTWPGLTTVRVLALGLALLMVTCAVLGRVQLFLLTLALEAGLALAVRHRVRAVLEPIEPYARSLAVYTELLARWGRPMGDSGIGSQSLSWLVRRLGWLRVAPLAAPVLGQTQLALAIEAWRHRHGHDLAVCLDAAGRAEALGALATCAYENPNDPFPELVEPGPCFEGDGLAHPLLPPGRCVPNDLCLGGGPRLLIVSGSNMSGKSTFLRTVGTNAVLALAGAPVRAARLRLSPLAVGATLRVQDSLQRGQSRFFAEITRLRQILDLAKGPTPVLFLLDELLSGTNSDDRRAGAEAVLRRLVESGAVGLVTTHDLALAPIADQFGPAGANVHFADRLEDGRLVFDYRVRPGVVRQHNALALMRAVGIDV